ncbi:MAG: hypothetical protein MPW15_13630 [Candidatus Manganitrophus sp.]|nr:hypothetical protein [Candidatus Manganitrophus sp.]
MIRFSRWNIGLQTKITLYVIAIVVSVLFDCNYCFPVGHRAAGPFAPPGRIHHPR